MKFIKGHNRNQINLFPVSLDQSIDPENEVRIIDLFVDSLKLEEYGFKTVFVENGRPAYHPADLLKIYIYGYLNKIRSSRDLEKECKRNIKVMWLLNSLKPDHNTISNFRRDNPKAIKNVFRETVRIAQYFDLIGGKLLAGDSTKFRAQNSNKNNFNQKKIDRHLEYIDNKHNVIILNAPKELTQLPKHVDGKTYAVRKNSSCSIDMVYAGCDDQYGHEFHCNAQPGECPFEGSCHKFRYIPIDTGAFGKIPYFLDGAQKIVAMRKVAERPFNLIKHRDGLEPLRTKGIHNSTVVATMANIATLLIEIAGHRKKVKTNKKQDKNLAFEFMKKAA